MRKRLLVFALSFTLSPGCAIFHSNPESRTVSRPLAYEVDLNDRADDLFKVTLTVDDLGAANAIYQFAATAPGTYQVMDIGRFVREFRAIDTDGNELPVQHLSTNQWRIAEPEKVREINYSIAETWDTPVDSNKVFEMAGTSIEDDHVQLLPHAVLGYPTGMQSRAIRLKLDYPAAWLVGTALRRDKEGVFQADTYDRAVDSPILMGRLSKASLKVKGTDIDVYTYSKTDLVKSDQILSRLHDILLASADFTEGLPVDHYTFLFHFEDLTLGAWEHSYSSNYVYKEADFEKLKDNNIPPVVAHEFFHVVTPLNIHSEIIEKFNFVHPVPSQHLWLYEATTEWAAHTMQLRAGLIDLETYLNRMSGKLRVADNFDQHTSLTQLALNSFTKEGQKQYGNIYQKGAVIAGLLDIRLLELSHGKMGLREVINKLAKKYGPHKAFSETNFFDTFTGMTFPEISDFFDSYIKGAEPLPLAAYFEKVGINYWARKNTGEEKATSGFTLLAPGGVITFTRVSDEARKFGLEPGDILVAYEGQEVNMKNIGEVFHGFRDLEAGVPYELTIDRQGEQHTFTCEKYMQEKVDRHVLEVNPDATPAQLALRKAWMTNF